MSYTRVFVIQSPLSRAANMKNVRATEATFKKHIRDKILSSYKLIEAGDRWVLITNFDTKAKANKYVKAMANTRRDHIVEPGGQMWAYQGPVKASG